MWIAQSVSVDWNLVTVPVRTRLSAQPSGLPTREGVGMSADAWPTVVSSRGNHH